MNLVNWIKSLFNKKEAKVIPFPASPAPLKSQALELSRDSSFHTNVITYLSASIHEDKKQEAMDHTQSALKTKSRYQAVSDKVNIPWNLIAGIHRMESDQNWQACLHNGDPIIGTGKKTTHVPKGRGPFSTWEEAAIDALTTEWRPEKWDLGSSLEFVERYNGLGYRDRGIKSPYVYGGTTAYIKGRFVADGKFDPNSIDHRPGIASMMKCLEELNEIKIT